MYPVLAIKYIYTRMLHRYNRLNCGGVRHSFTGFEWHARAGDSQEMTHTGQNPVAHHLCTWKYHVIQKSGIIAQKNFEYKTYLLW